MKRILTLTLALVIALGIIGCSEKEKKDADVSKTVSDTTAEETVTDTEKTEETTATADPDTPSVKVSVYTETFTQGECSVTLMYPRYGDGKHDLFDVAMRNIAMQEYGSSGILTEDSAVYEILSCDVKYESEFYVSAVVIGQIINPVAASDTNFAYTVNADPRDGRIYLSEDLIGNLDMIKAAFAEGKFTRSYGFEGIMNEITPDIITGSWRQDYGVFPDMYFTHDSFGIMAEVPSVVGGYAGFELPYAETFEMINPMAKGFVGIIVTTD